VFVGRCGRLLTLAALVGWRGSKLKTVQKTCLAVHFFIGTPDTKITASGTKAMEGSSGLHSTTSLLLQFGRHFF
jgi:hypothetical protein